jgi:hypothetical protein
MNDSLVDAVFRAHAELRMMAHKRGRRQTLAFRVDKVSYTQQKGTPRVYTLLIDPEGIDDPNDPRELLLIKYTSQDRIAFFRDDEWRVQGTIQFGKVTLWQEE